MIPPPEGGRFWGLEARRVGSHLQPPPLGPFSTSYLRRPIETRRASAKPLRFGSLLCVLRALPRSGRAGAE
ncbi:hypothetical protein CPAR01_11773 [Colletotrichum paranaense]|uniref:Uncharacterized protein n=2 Tax=Colletotrichum acutatum species complex TaxID=2707335 RepID=A0A9Q8SWQ8_9PEZI|nr:uncharacterized protein CLUP02_10017 [Colletotrichum lupini]XP_060344816.1 uncharacterized protein CPAR01_11773 [Colletotrichum paranaense]KAK1529461.1 hypothetical protein CPAR01_11773 [Colletotrichum paranaense]UQC84520.1 hypothetical protein CLUP02_10017 [Colletotrichum lupini]